MSDSSFDITLKGNKIAPEFKTVQNIPRKKKKNQKSKSSKRADHKHQYEDAILESFIGWSWGSYCAICGRIQENKLCFRNKEFIKTEYQNSCSIGQYMYFSIEELKEKYRGIPVFVLDKEKWEYKRVN